MNSINKVALALLTCIVMFGALSANAYASDFGTFQHDNYHTGVTTDSAPTVTPTAGWSAFGTTTGWSGFDVAPIVGGDKVFEVAYNGTVYAYNKTTGDLVWSTPGLSGNGSFELATPAYNNGILYVALCNVYDYVNPFSSNTSLYAIYANNGTVKWSALKIDNMQTNTPVIYDSGRVYFGTANVTSEYTSDKGSYYCYNANTGSRIWSYTVMRIPATGYYWAGAAVIGNYIVFGDGGSYLLSLNKATGIPVLINGYINLAQTFPGISAGKVQSTISYNPDTDRIYFTSTGGYCFAIGYNSANGRFNTNDKWATHIGSTSTSTPAVYDGKVFVGTGGFSTGIGDNFVCLSESNGFPLWSVETNGGVQSSPVVSVNQGTGDYHVYFTTNTWDGTLYCVDSGGNTEWTYLPPPDKQNYVLQGVAISDGFVYFGNDAGYVFGLKQ